jgi:cation:H+ antiporter
MQRLLLWSAFAITGPALYLKLTGLHMTPPLSALIFGLGVLGAAFLLSWAAEVAQMDIPRALAVAVLALIAVLPEYAVDLYFAWTAAERPEYTAYATANMTGSNRLLVGFGWALIVWVYALRFRRREVLLEPEHRIEISFLGFATLYSFLLPFKDTLSLLDTLILLAIFGFYVWRTLHAEVHEPELVGPARLIGNLSTFYRRFVTFLLFLFSAVVIFLVAEPFAESLVASGTFLGIDEFLLVQWLAPLASEAPEFIVAILWTLRGDAAAGLGALLSAKVNQWTLLIGTIPLVYSINLGGIGALTLDLRQQHELLLTSAQSLFALAVLANLSLSLWESLGLFSLFAVQLFIPDIRIEVSYAYMILSVILILRKRSYVLSTLRGGLQVSSSSTANKTHS